jgi:Family of unknown function (DUF6010)
MSGFAATQPDAEAAARRPLRTHLPEMVVGLVAGLVAVATALFATSADDARLMLGTLLAGIGFVYLGFSIADGRRSAIVIQAISALVFLWVAQIAIREDSNLLLGLGFLAHGAWDALHHEGHGWTKVRTYYPPFCAAADVVIGAAILSGIAV